MGRYARAVRAAGGAIGADRADDAARGSLPAGARVEQQGPGPGRVVRPPAPGYGGRASSEMLLDATGRAGRPQPHDGGRVDRDVQPARAAHTLSVCARTACRWRSTTSARGTRRWSGCGGPRAHAQDRPVVRGRSASTTAAAIVVAIIQLAHQASTCSRWRRASRRRSSWTSCSSTGATWGRATCLATRCRRRELRALLPPAPSVPWRRPRPPCASATRVQPRAPAEHRWAAAAVTTMTVIAGVLGHHPDGDARGKQQQRPSSMPARRAGPPHSPAVTYRRPFQPKQPRRARRGTGTARTTPTCSTPAPSPAPRSLQHPALDQGAHPVRIRPRSAIRPEPGRRGRGSAPRTARPPRPCRGRRRGLQCRCDAPSA